MGLNEQKLFKMQVCLKEVQNLCFIFFLTVKAALQTSGSNKANFIVVNIVAESKD